MANTSPNIYTNGSYNVSTALTISRNNGITKLSIQFVSGAPTVTAGGTIGGLASSAITLSSTITSLSIQTDQPMDGIVIAGTGVVAIVAS